MTPTPAPSKALSILQTIFAALAGGALAFATAAAQGMNLKQAGWTGGAAAVTTVLGYLHPSPIQK